LKPDVSTVEICITTIGTNCLNRSVSTPSPDTREGIFSNSFHPRKREQKANQTGSGLYHSIVKELVLPGRQEELRTNPNLTGGSAQSQAVLSRKNNRQEDPSQEGRLNLRVREDGGAAGDSAVTAAAPVADAAQRWANGLVIAAVSH